MNLSSALLPFEWHLAAWLIVAVILFRCIRTAPWKRLAEPERINVWLGFAVALMLFWSMKAGVKPGLNLHLLGAMAATLAFGPQLAMLALGVALAGIALNGAIDWAAWPANFILMAAIPVFVANRIHRAVERHLPNHFFVFIFLTAFFGSAITVMLQGLVASATLVAAGAYSAEFLASDYLPYFLLLGFAEAWISGMLITVMVVYRPGWIVAFDDERYLRNK